MSEIRFIAIPKSGSMSVAAMCRSIGVEVLWHNRNPNSWRSMVGRISPGDTTFCIIRDPVERVVSAYNFLLSGGTCAADKRDAGRWIGGRTLDGFVRERLNRAAERQIHFRPASYWIEGVDACCLRFSNLMGELSSFLAHHGLDAQAPQHINATQYTDRALSCEAVEIIKEVYSRDYTLIP